MSEQIEALKLALKDLKWVDYWIGEKPMSECVTKLRKAITAIKEALAQEQEPVGRFAKFTDGIWRPVTDYSAGVPLYTHPPQRTEQNFCSRCGKRTKDIHTCTPPMEKNT